MTEKFKIKEALKFGWKSVEKNFWFFVFLAGILIIIGVLFGGISGWLDKNPIKFAFLIETAMYVVQLIFGLILTKILLNYFDEEKNRFKQLDKALAQFPQYLLGHILYFFIILGGLILFIVPGIIWAIKYQFFSYLIVDKDMTAIKAIKKSGEMTKGVKGNLFGLGFVLVGINILGFFTFFVGLLISIPISWLVVVCVYRKLLNNKNITVSLSLV